MEELVEPDVAVEDVPLGQAVCALKVKRRENLPGHDGTGHVRRERADPRDDLVAQFVPALIPGAFREAVRDFGLGYTVEDEADVTLPGYVGSTSLQYANPVG